MIAWMNLTSSQYWQVRITQALVLNSTGGTMTQILTSVIDFLLDSGSSYSYIPSNDYQKLYQTMFSRTCKKNSTSQLVYCNCTSTNDTRYMNISLYVGNRFYLYFNRTDYFTYDSVRKQCLLTILENTDVSASYWLMGDSFMRAYYVIHDMAN